MAKSVELYTTDFALEAQGATYRGLIVVNKVLKNHFGILNEPEN